MAQELGDQYGKDGIADPSGFLAKARLHQSKYRFKRLNVPCDGYGNYLQKTDAWDRGLNFYDDFGIFDAVKSRYPRYSKLLYANMLRSEHIPFNLFVPFEHDMDFCRVVWSELTGVRIRTVDAITIEHAPKPPSKYLNDKTSFDVYVEYSHEDRSRGILGIEVKYTERSYTLMSGSKEAIAVYDEKSPYYSVSTTSGLYKPNAIEALRSEKFRQIWRNHLLGESILIADKDTFKHFSSVTIFPEGNIHFVEASKEYMELLVQNDHKFVPVTYEQLLGVCEKHCPNERNAKWIEYLRSRYIVEES